VGTDAERPDERPEGEELGSAPFLGNGTGQVLGPIGVATPSTTISKLPPCCARSKKYEEASAGVEGNGSRKGGTSI